MTTEQLIRSLSGTVTAVPRYAVGRRIALGLGCGAAITLLLVVALLGIRPDLDQAMHGGAFWTKWAYSASLGACAIFATARLARPGDPSLRWLWLMAVPVLLLAGSASAEWAAEAPAARLAMWLGTSWKICPWIVLLLAVPIFIGLLWSFRRLAPTRLRAAGAAAGLCAGACSATLYGLHCPETSAMFVLTWYSLGIVLAVSCGALLGPRLLRW